MEEDKSAHGLYGIVNALFAYHHPNDLLSPEVLTGTGVTSA
jgi:hypothetical protein